MPQSNTSSATAQTKKSNFLRDGGCTGAQNGKPLYYKVVQP